jgi:hypothetical protein
VVELTWDPGAYATHHSHPTALITCVQEGALGFVLHHGAAMLVRGGTADAPGSPVPLELETEVVLEPRDCITFDEFASHMEHTGWNASEETTVLWEARLLNPVQPFTTYVDAMGTPVPWRPPSSMASIGLETDRVRPSRPSPIQCPDNPRRVPRTGFTSGWLAGEQSAPGGWTGVGLNSNERRSGRAFPRCIVRREPQGDRFYLFS